MPLISTASLPDGRVDPATESPGAVVAVSADSRVGDSRVGDSPIGDSPIGDSPRGDSIVARVRERQLHRVDVLERAVLALMDDTLDDALRELAASEAHTLASAMPSFGLSTGGRLARALEQSFSARFTLGRPIASRLADQVLALRAELERPLAPARTFAPALDQASVVVALQDPERAEAYVAEGLTQGLLVHHVDHHTDVQLVRNLAPRVVVLELPPVASAASRATVTRFARSGVPMLVLGGGGTLAERVAIARCGAVGPLAGPLGTADVLERALQLTRERRSPLGTILVVDTDPFAGQTARLALERTGHLVYTLFEPERIIETLELVEPELLLVGARLGQVTGVELVLAVRADPRWRELPAMLAAAPHEQQLVREAYADGIDDVIQKPIEPGQLLTRVGNRLRLSRTVRRRGETDVVTGLPSRVVGARAMSRLLSLVQRHGEHFAYLLFRLDRVDELRARHGQAAVDAGLRTLARLLRATVRGDDVIARWGAAELAVGLFEATSDVAHERARDMLTAFRAQPIMAPSGEALTLTASASVACVPEYTADVEQLSTAADVAFLHDGAHTTDAVLGGAAGAGGEVTRRVDVLLVESDPAVAALVMHAIEGRRLTVRWVRDGGEARDALLGEPATVLPRVTLMEVNLPSLDGLSLLRAIAGTPLLKRSRVVMLSERTSEAETLQAFELGAFDYVAKPFSVPVLMERLRRALRA